MMSNCMEFISCTDEELINMGTKAQQFIVSDKNAFKQAKKVIDFMKTFNN